MSVSLSQDPDAVLRAAAFARLRDLEMRWGDLLPAAVLSEPFGVQGKEMRLANRARGIFKPAAMRSALSIKTTVPRQGRRQRYADQAVKMEHFTEGDAPLTYAFQGDDPDNHDNASLRRAFEQQLPLIWFWGVAEGQYRPIAPVFVTKWDPSNLQVEIVPGLPAMDRFTPALPERNDDRRYATRLAKQRLHQTLFRTQVVTAYHKRCAFSGLPVLSLVDAAHIVEDRDEALGHPVVSNGICASKLHHAAFDAHLLGVDPDCRIHVAERLRAEHDGPLLEGLKALHGLRLTYVPREAHLQPDRERLAVRFERFLQVSG